MILEAQDEDKVLGCRGGMSTVAGCGNGYLRSRERHSV